MGKYKLSIIAIFISVSIFSQDTLVKKSLSIELSTRYERAEFKGNYQLYTLLDGNFMHLSKTGNRTGIRLATAIQISKRNSLVFGVGVNLYQSRLNRERIRMVFLDLELGHRYIIFDKSDYSLSLENALSFGNNPEFSNYFLESFLLEWKPGLHIEKSLSKKLNLFFGVHYSIGILNSLNRESITLIQNARGLKIGMKYEI